MNGLHSTNFDFGECHGLCYTNFDKTDGLKPTSETIKNGIEMGTQWSAKWNTT